MAMSVVYSTFGGSVVYENRGGTERFYGSDPLGSTAALYDSAGTKTDEWTYYPYGEVATHTGTSATPFTFAGTLGYYMDSASRYYVKARHYLASLARWMSVDPLWPDESAYGYCHSSPVNWNDYTGLKKCGSPPGCRVEPADRTACVAECKRQGKAYRTTVCFLVVDFPLIVCRVRICGRLCVCFAHK